MLQRIRVSALVVRDGGLLLVQHVANERKWWCPPGGGVDGAEMLSATAERELREETGIEASAKRIVYLMDFVVPNPPCRNLEVYMLMENAHGEPVVPSNESCFLKQARFVTQNEMREMTVYPAELRETFWVDLETGFTETRYLGLTTVDR